MIPEKIFLTNLELLVLMREGNEFLKEKLSLLVKYKITQLLNEIDPILKPFIEIRNQEIKKYAPDGVLLEDNPGFKEYQEFMKPIDDEKKEINTLGLSFEIVQNIETTNNYIQLYKLFNHGNV